MANADGLEHMLNRVMPKDNIGLAALLQTTEAAWENSKLDLYNTYLRCYLSRTAILLIAHIF